MPSTQIYNYRLFAICFLSVALGAMNSVLSSAYLPDIVGDLGGAPDVLTTSWVSSWVNFAFLAGGTLGGIGLSFLSDRIGRKMILMISLVLYGLGSGLGAVSTSWEILVITRVLVGAGVGAVLVASAVMVAEAWWVKTRAVALGILSVAYPVGIIASGIVTSTVKDWHVAFMMGALALLLVIPVWWWVQESTEWSDPQTKVKPPKWAEYKTSLISGIVIYGTMLIGLWATFSWLPTWVQTLLGNESDGQAQRGLSMTLLGAGGLAGGIVSGFLSNRFGGRTIQAGCFIVCLVLSCFIFQFNTTFSVQVMVAIACLGICFGISQGVLNEYIPELFPAALRSAATGLCFHIGRAFTAAAVFFVGAFVLWFDGYGNAIFAFSSVYVIGLLALLFLRNRNVPPSTTPLIDPNTLDTPETFKPLNP